MVFFIPFFPVLSQKSVADKYFYQALEHDNRKEYQEAAKLYLKAIAEDGRLFSAAINLAIIYDNWGKDNAAQSLYDQAAQIAPHSFEALYNRARFLQRKGKLAEAQSDYLKALEIRPQEASLYVNLAALEIGLYELNREEKLLTHAEKRLTKAEALKYHSPALYFNRARIMELKNAPARARTLYREAMRYFDRESIEYHTCLIRTERLDRQLR